MTTIRWHNPVLSLRAPEWVLVMYAFLLHFAWEMLQTPFFEAMAAMAHWPATLVCLQATLGDAAIALAAFGITAAVRHDRGWFLAPPAGALAIYLAAGLLITVALELHAVYWAQRWAYSSLMPVLPGVRVGLVPIVQWIVIPLATLFLLQRHHLGVPEGRVRPHHSPA